MNSDSTLDVSYCPEVESEEFQPKYKSAWIQTVGRHPLVLHEPTLSARDNSFGLVEEFFERHSWIPNEYVKMGSERFMEKYCWA